MYWSEVLVKVWLLLARQSDTRNVCWTAIGTSHSWSLIAGALSVLPIVILFSVVFVLAFSSGNGISGNGLQD